MLSELATSDVLLWEVAVRAAIATDPAAFSASVEDLERLTEADWQASLERYCTDQSIALVDVDGTDGSVVAMVCVEISSDQLSALVTNLWVALPSAGQDADAS